VRLTQPYYLGAYEVTHEQFRRFVKVTGYQTDLEQNGKGGWSNHQGAWVRRPEHVWATPGEWQTQDDEPVVHVTWNDAKAFCDWLSARRADFMCCRRRRNGNSLAEPARPA